MATVLPPRATSVNLNNIPLNVANGYGYSGAGKVTLPDGEFLLYGSISLSTHLDFTTEMISAANMLLTEIPCDGNGNILLKSSWMSQLTNDSWLDPQQLFCFLLCSSEPTHRVDLVTGDISSNADDNQYIRNILMQFGSGVWE